MNFSFNTPTPNTGLGGAAAPASSFAFGAPKPATVAPPAFGAVPTLGSAAATAVVAPAFGGFGAAQPVSAAPTLSFGQAATAPTSALPAFGAAPATNTLPSFGGAQTTPALSIFGQTTMAAAPLAPTFTFGQSAGTVPPTTAPPAFGSFGGAPAAATTAANAVVPGAIGAGVGAFSFNKPQATTAASLNFNTITTTATVQPFQTSFRLGGTPAATTSSSGIFGKSLTTTTQAATAPPAFVGLGGIDVSATQPKLGDNKQDGVKIKETQVPDEIVKTVDALKSFIKQQKSCSSDIGRTSTSKFNNVGNEIIKLKWTLQNMANSVDVSHQQIKQLRTETSKAIQSLEMSQRTQDTPAGLQFEHSAPFQYFQCLVSRYEQDLISFRQQITMTERHMQALANPRNISPEDLKRGLRQLSESFTSLAGRMHELHQRVEEQKEHYLKLRRLRLRDSTNVFEKIEDPSACVAEPQRITCGPTPFSRISAMNTLNNSYAAAVAAASTPK